MTRKTTIENDLLQIFQFIKNYQTIQDELKVTNDFIDYKRSFDLILETRRTAELNCLRDLL